MRSTGSIRSKARIQTVFGLRKSVCHQPPAISQPVDTSLVERQQFQSMRSLCCVLLLLFSNASGFAQNHSYLFVWAGDDAKASSDFLAVIDADAASPHYGQAVASVPVPGPSGTPHHTELEMPQGGFLLANAFESGRSMLFDLREPLHPSLVTSFGDLDGYMHPHTYARLANGDVLATFQYHGGHDSKADGGGLVQLK
jgi:hypothetical protein